MTTHPFPPPESRTAADWLRAAQIHEQRGEPPLALQAYQALLRLQPAHPGALLRVAQAALTQGELEQPLLWLQQAARSAEHMRLGASALPVFQTWIGALRQAQRCDEAFNVVQGGIKLCGEQAWLLWQGCELLNELERPYDRLHLLNRLAFLHPDDPIILGELGLALVHGVNAQQALKPLSRAVALGDDRQSVLMALASLELREGLQAQAEQRLRAVLAQTPDALGALGKLWLLLREACRWAEAAAVENHLLHLLEQNPEAIDGWLTPFSLLDTQIKPLTLRRYTEHYQRAVHPMPPDLIPLAPDTQPLTGRRLRVGYLSGDFHTHAVASHIVGLLEQHDRSAVECFAYSSGARVEDDAYRQRIKACFEPDHWRDLNELGDAAAAKRIAADRLDVLVDLSGDTFGNRLGVLAYRPARTILHYLGFPGTSGLDCIDYLVSDATVTPASHQAFYREKLLLLPDSYQVNDATRPRPAPTPRSALGLADDAIVLCNFNRPGKWSETFLRIWLHALQQHERAVLWLVDRDSQTVRDAVQTLAATHGVAERIHWAPKLPLTEHLARHAAADLALDQLPYSSHATGATALWMGVPLLTCLGDSFPGRVGASLAQAAELPHFVTPSIAQYERRLDELLRAPEQLVAAKHHLNSQHRQLPLFDGARFARNWEAMLRQISS